MCFKNAHYFTKMKEVFYEINYIAKLCIKGIFLN